MFASQVRNGICTIKMITKIKINTHFSLWGAISIYQSECCGVCMKRKLQKQEIVRKIEFRIETRRPVKAERKRQLPVKKKHSLPGAEQMKQWPKRKNAQKKRGLKSVEVFGAGELLRYHWQQCQRLQPVPTAISLGSRLPHSLVTEVTCSFFYSTESTQTCTKHRHMVVKHYVQEYCSKMLSYPKEKCICACEA